MRPRPRGQLLMISLGYLDCVIDFFYAIFIFLFLLFFSWRDLTFFNFFNMEKLTLVEFINYFLILFINPFFSFRKLQICDLLKKGDFYIALKNMKKLFKVIIIFTIFETGILYLFERSIDYFSLRVTFFVISTYIYTLKYWDTQHQEDYFNSL